MGHAFDVSKSIVGKILDEVFQAIWEQLREIHMQSPTADFLIDTAQDFFLTFDVPHCCGAVDVSHIPIKKSAHSGSQFYNYKKYYSVTLQGLVDANFRFISIDVGGFGSQHDSTTFLFSKLYQGFVTGSLKFPDSDELYYSNVVAPYFFVRDVAYPLSRNLIKPYPGFNLTREQKLFNHRVFTARVTVERAFGLFKQTWRMFHKTLEYPPDKVEAAVQCACILHNVMINLEKINGEPVRALPNRHQGVNEVFTGNREKVEEKLMRFFPSN
ncbi:protein ANTAGONIST OF LIKE HETEROCHROMATIN PROTEIN 1-like [Trichogramma pretiosum]|uniref:protein ANTAGONIST OF LIKE HETEROCHROMATIN PROTEIN 1-like n=1 Tax=Trichogramma pretiosum TaxID=7493 RepID=UPI0006C9642B|nr:protein ANTAGONIST OF LIKE HETEROCHROMATIN PROTEIN 1-like [Trichogramma pretiosum]